MSMTLQLKDLKIFIKMKDNIVKEDKLGTLLKLITITSTLSIIIGKTEPLFL